MVRESLLRLLSLALSFSPYYPRRPAIESWRAPRWTHLVYRYWVGVDKSFTFHGFSAIRKSVEDANLSYVRMRDNQRAPNLFYLHLSHIHNSTVRQWVETGVAGTWLQTKAPLLALSTRITDNLNKMLLIRRLTTAQRKKLRKHFLMLPSWQTIRDKHRERLPSP